MVHVLDDYNLALAAIVTVGFQLFFFTIAAITKSDKVTDFAGGANFVVLALMSCLVAWTFHLRQIAVTIMVAVWGARLAEYCLHRIITIGRDERFDGIRESVPRFALFWIGQAIWVFVVSLPMLIVNGLTEPSERTYPRLPEFGTAADIVGVLMWVVGFFIEAVADWQKFSFRTQPQNQGRFCGFGLWSWSRHPNYFGDILVWFGVFTVETSVIGYGLDTDPNWSRHWTWVGILSPLFTAVLLLFISGMPKLEKNSDVKYGDLPEYQDYKNTVSPLIPVHPALYSRLPYIVKLLFFFEYPLYDSEKLIKRRRTEL